MMRVLAIDPGLRGGAALLEDGALVAWACWRPCAGGVRVWQAPTGASLVSETGLAGVGVVLSWLWPDRLVVESLHIRRGIAAASVIALAEGLGQTVAPILLARPGIPFCRVKPDKWASLCGGTGPDQTERAVREVRRRGIALPHAEIIAGPNGPTKADFDNIGAIAEAVLMALSVGAP